MLEKNICLFSLNDMLNRSFILTLAVLLSRRRCVQRADHVRLVPEGRREALLSEHGERAEELLQ